MIAKGSALMGVGFATEWRMKLEYQESASGPYAFSIIEGVKADAWPVINLQIPFQVGQENQSADFFIKLQKFIEENLPEQKVHIGIKQEG